MAVPGAFDGLLLAHVVEHMDREQALGSWVLLRSTLARFRRMPAGCSSRARSPRGPQERGYASDSTHVWFAQDSDLAELVGTLGLELERSFSFPFPRKAGKLFIYNEFCVTARVPL